MSFERVDVGSLKNAINACKNSLSCQNSRDVASSISAVCRTSSADKLRGAISTLVNERYRALENMLNSYLNVAGLIGEYQGLESDNRNMNAQLPSLRDRLYYTVWECETRWDAKGKPYEHWYPDERKDYNVEREINRLEQKIRQNDQLMSQLESQIARSI